MKKSIHSLSIVTVGKPGSTDEKDLAQSLIATGFGLLGAKDGPPRIGSGVVNEVCRLSLAGYSPPRAGSTFEKKGTHHSNLHIVGGICQRGLIRLSFSWLHKAKEVLILDFFLELRDVLEI